METEEIVQTLENEQPIVPPPTDEDLVGYSPAPAFKLEPDEITKSEPAKQTEKLVTQQTQKKEGQYSYNPVWDHLKEKGIEIPEVVTKGKFEEGTTEYDVLVQSIIDNTEFPGENDPFITGYLQAEDKDAYIGDYKTVQSIVGLSPDDGLRFVFKNELNAKGERVYTDDDIEEEMGKMTILQKKREWKAYQENIGKMQQDLTAQRETQRVENIKKNLGTIQEKRLQVVNTLLAEEDKIKEINGLPYTEDMRNQFKQDFIELNKIDPETGIPFFNKMLMDNTVLTDVMRAYSLFKDNRIKHHISNAKEQAKKEVLERTDLNPKLKSGTTKTVVGNTENDYDV